MPKGRGLHREPQLGVSWLPAPHPGSAAPRPGLQHSHPAAGWWAPLCPGPRGQAPRGALLLRGCHGPALHAAPPAPRGQTQRQLPTHLSALPHQGLTPADAHTHLWPHQLLLAPSICPLGLSPSLHPSRPSSSLVPVSAGPDEGTGKGFPESERVPRPHAMLTQSLALCSLLPLRGWEAGSGGPPVPAPRNGRVHPVTRASKLPWMKACSGNLSLSGTAGHCRDTKNPLACFWGLNTGLASGRDLVALHYFALNKYLLSPSWFGSVDRALACVQTKGFDSGQGHTPRLRAPFPVGGVQEAANQ